MSVVCIRACDIVNPQLPTQWGPWRRCDDLLVLEDHNGRWVYEVPLAELRTSARVLDWIMQVASKRYDNVGLAGRDVVGWLVDALNELLHPQATLCSGGTDRKLSKKRMSALLNRELCW